MIEIIYTKKVGIIKYEISRGAKGCYGGAEWLG